MHVLYPRLSNTGVHNIFLCEKLPNVLILFHAVLTIVILKFEWLYQKKERENKKCMIRRYCVILKNVYKIWGKLYCFKIWGKLHDFKECL